MAVAVHVYRLAGRCRNQNGRLSRTWSTSGLLPASSVVCRWLTCAKMPARRPGRAPAGTNRMLTVLPATGDWVIRDTAGHRLGWTGGQWVAEIPGGYSLPQTLADATRAGIGRANCRRALPRSRPRLGRSRRIDYSLFVDGRVLEVNGQTIFGGHDRRDRRLAGSRCDRGMQPGRL